MVEFVDALNVVCNDGDEPCSLAIPYIIQTICQQFIESVITWNRFSRPGASHTECYRDQTMLG